MKDSQPIIIGVTGGSGSGKPVLAVRFLIIFPIIQL